MKEAKNVHPRWSRATDAHKEEVQRILFAIIGETGPLDGGVTADLVKYQQTTDLLDLAALVLEHDPQRGAALSPILEAARTPAHTVPD